MWPPPGPEARLTRAGEHTPQGPGMGLGAPRVRRLAVAWRWVWAASRCHCESKHRAPSPWALVRGGGFTLSLGAACGRLSCAVCMLDATRRGPAAHAVDLVDVFGRQLKSAERPASLEARL